MPPSSPLAKLPVPHFGTKAETLERLTGRLQTARVLPVFYFTAQQWQSDRAKILGVLSAQAWAKEAIIVRSSARAEDGQHASLAGAFTSKANVQGEAQWGAAIEAVIASYGARASSGDQVLVQPMLKAIHAAGVAFSCDPNSGAPYRVINYDDSSGRADGVTAGLSNTLKTSYVWQTAKAPEGLPARVVSLLEELESLLGSQKLDIEFALSGDELVLLQARPLVVHAPPVNAKAQAAALARIAEGIEKGLSAHPYISGKRTVYGIMPDWNPAEIIGVRPKPLAFSLYRELVTDAVWAYQRDNYGYGNLRSFPLLVDFEGLPYVDVRASFNSFLPKELPPALAEKLVDYYIQRLIDNPELHDKVEFEIIFSCYTLDLRDRVKILLEHGFSEEECTTLVQALTALTNRILHRDTGLWKRDRHKIDVLEQRQQTIKQSDMNDISKLYWLVEDCKRYGTLPFAGLARAGFIAVQLLRSFITAGILTEREYQAFLGSLECVSTQMARDLATQPRDAFLARYGHLRPGTYDILSPRYDEAPERYFDWLHIAEQENTGSDKHAGFTLSLAQLKKIESFIARDGIDIDILGLLEFIKAGIESREYAKFVFTCNVSDFLQLFERVAAEYGFNREDCAYVNVHDILALHSATHDVQHWLAQSIERGRARHKISRAILLPPLLISPQDAWQFTMPESMPNYITQKQVEAEKATLDSDQFENRIVMLDGADPGYDWLFSHRIAGFITRYGGVNSHMAIRSGELGIPAVIGAGDVLYDQWIRAKRLRIDCMNRQVQVLQ